MAFNFKVKVPKLFKSVRYCLAAVNSIFLVTGFLLVIVGIVVLMQYYEFEEIITQQFFTIPGFVIATGVIIFLGSILGFYGAISEQFYFIAGYVVLMIVIVIFEVSIVIVGYKLRNDAATKIRAPMVESLRFYETRWEVAMLWDNLHMEFECCGVVGRGDFVSNRIPVSCCHIDYGTISPFECGISNAYEVGCASVLGEWLSYNAYVIGVTALVALCIQVPLTAMAGWLAWRSKYEEVELES